MSFLSSCESVRVEISVEQLFGHPWDPNVCVICNSTVNDDINDQVEHLAEHGAKKVLVGVPDRRNAE